MNESPVFPMQPAPFKGESREVDPGSCFDWLAQGWAMFLAHPGVWLGASILLLVILMAISIVPLFGQVAAHLLARFSAEAVGFPDESSCESQTSEIQKKKAALKAAFLN